MKRSAVALLACSALAAAAGCGSSGPSGSSSAGSGGSSAPSSESSATTAAAVPTSSLKVQTKPKYAAPSASLPVQSGLVQVAYRNIAINPDTIRVRAGATIRWTNYDNVRHNVTSEGGPQRFASQNFGEGETFEIKATRPGLIHYLCTIHPASMNATIEVVR